MNQQFCLSPDIEGRLADAGYVVGIQTLSNLDIGPIASVEM